jgi:hypothetical protein
MSSTVAPDLTATAAEPASLARPRSWGTLALVGLLLIGLAMFLRVLERPAEWVIPADEIAHTDGRAWIVKVQDRLDWPWQAQGGDPYDPFRSDLLLFEEGRRLEPHRAALEVIRTSGGGAYTHWGRRLWFSTSDGTDPRSNGREYRVSFTAHLAPRLLRRLAGRRVRAAGLWPGRFALGLSPRGRAPALRAGAFAVAPAAGCAAGRSHPGRAYRARLGLSATALERLRQRHLAALAADLDSASCARLSADDAFLASCHR